MMTKKEQVEVAALKEELSKAKAFRFTEPVTADIPPPSAWNELSRGWTQHTWNDTYSVGKACSSSVDHGFGWEKTNAQRPIHLYSSRLLALRAARVKMENRFAEVLAKIDAEIEEERLAEVERKKK